MGDAAVTCRGLTKTYEDGTRAVRGLDLDVHVGECFGLLGPNGAGKTTTIEILEGLLAPTAGDVAVLGLDWKHHDAELRRRIGVTLQQTDLPDRLRVAEVLHLFRSFYAESRSIDRLLATVSLEEKRDAFYDKLSGGQKQRLSIACALAGDPDLLFLDEPTSGLDPQSRRQLWDVVREFKAEGRTVVITTHYMEEAERLCDRVAIVDGGQAIARGTPAELIAQLGGKDVIEITAPGADAIDDAAFEALPGVHHARKVGGARSLTVEPLHDALSAVVGMLEEREITLDRLVTRHATLEDVFIALTGRGLRD